MSRPVDYLDCARVSELLESVVDGELEPNENDAVEAHLAGCASCAGELQLAREIHEQLSALPLLDPPERVLSTVDRLTKAEQEIGSPGLARIRPIGSWPGIAAVAAVAVLMVVLFPWGRGSEEEVSRVEAENAAADARLALAYVADLTRRAERVARSRVVEDEAVARTLRGVSRSLKWTGEVRGAAPRPSKTPKNKIRRSLS
jgi:anti-sigma factor RsiW